MWPPKWRGVFGWFFPSRVKSWGSQQCIRSVIKRCFVISFGDEKLVTLKFCGPTPTSSSCWIMNCIFKSNLTIIFESIKTILVDRDEISKKFFSYFSWHLNTPLHSIVQHHMMKLKNYPSLVLTIKLGTTSLFLSQEKSFLLARHQR